MTDPTRDATGDPACDPACDPGGDASDELARDTFVRIAMAPPHDGQLLRGAEALSHLLQRGHTWAGYELRLSELETLACARVGAMADASDAARARAVLGVLREQGIEGNDEHYTAVENSFIDRVLETGRGLPITLAILAGHLAQAAKVPLVGIGFPGHFVVGVGLDTETPTIFDPFRGGTSLSLQDLAQLYSAATGRTVTAGSTVLRNALVASPHRTVLIRLANNLHRHYLAKGAADRAAQVVELLSLVQPQRAALRQLAGELGRRARTLN